MAVKKTYVLDTSVCLADYSSIESFGNNDIVLPLKVLEEIDNHKKRQDGVGINARSIIRKLDELRTRGNLQKGVRIAKGKGVLRVASSLADLPESLDRTIPDNIIMSTALFIKRENIKQKTILVSRDINMRVISDSLGLESEDFKQNQIIKEQTDLYSGFKHLACDEQLVDKIYNNETVLLESETHPGLCVNEFIMMVSAGNEKKTALVRFRGYDKPLRRIRDQKKEIWGIKARNKEQLFALDLLMDPEIKLVSLVGRAGSGKTLIAVAAAMEQTINNASVQEMARNKDYRNQGKEYKKIVVSRPVMPVGKDIGFLPGDIREKMAPWIAPIYDNLKFLTDDNQKMLDAYLDNQLIEIEAVTYIRGRSIANAFIIVDEAQNLTQHEIKTILTRVGEGTKIILTGDIEQIDNIYIDSTSSGLTYAIERLKDYDFTGHVTLTKGERSIVATIASKVL